MKTSSLGSSTKKTNKWLIEFSEKQKELLTVKWADICKEAPNSVTPSPLKPSEFTLSEVWECFEAIVGYTVTVQRVLASQIKVISPAALSRRP